MERKDVIEIVHERILEDCRNTPTNEAYRNAVTTTECLTVQVSKEAILGSRAFDQGILDPMAKFGLKVHFDQF